MSFSYTIYMQLWERRSAQVTDQEKDKWIMLKPTHMSEEEEMDSETVLRRRPIWRSGELNAFLDTLDVRANKASRAPRKERQVGSPLQSNFPDDLPNWMLRANTFTVTEMNFFCPFIYFHVASTSIYSFQYSIFLFIIKAWKREFAGNVGVIKIHDYVIRCAIHCYTYCYSLLY